MDNDLGSNAPYVKPTVMYAHEHRSRSLNLNSLTPSGNLTTVDLDPASVPQITRAGLSWMSYEYVDGAWSAIDAADYIDLIGSQLATHSFFQAVEKSGDVRNACNHL